MTGWIVLLAYIALFTAGYFLVRLARWLGRPNRDFTSLKTVTFGDESAIRPDRAASFLSVLVVFLIWGAFTGSNWAPFHVPGPFVGDAQFTYTAENAAGDTDDGTVTVRVHPVGEDAEDPQVDPGTGFALNDVDTVGAWRSTLIRPTSNDEGEDLTVTAVDGQSIAPGETVKVADGEVTMTPKGSLNFQPAKGLQMEPIWMPPPEDVLHRFIEIATEGYQNFTLWQHLGSSLMRVLAGFFLGSLVGIPLGYAMGLSGWFRGWFDPIVEFMRPVPPLALIPLVIIWFGIWETGKIVLLFLAALWVMTIAARAGVSGVAISKVHAAYSLGASKRQVLMHVILPNSLPEIFTGARVAMGVCWGTVVAAELVAAQKGAGMMIIAASKFQLTDIVLMGIILIGIIGYGIDIAMRFAERVLVPWKGKV
ncbi:Putative aliphatic sulfonates transport permease protein SsuC [Pseudooceanicola marinus]|uniref:Putative aliphatic sulfonates transport permease protein SsuC n=1 Tax=Pseudooceanicola marinus TaxID=396013 RepID=A0A1X6YD05_9RHOB|nr:ABC transporter permease subunit [Pseudooceanicola marinus]PJE32955.1 taurine ABC transporter permease [Pseudooceanicola marinus]SLN17460.1 Putative aliphatic sulfonates transport permease protein SsuC [Pseudooceanicola marinus]